MDRHHKGALKNGGDADVEMRSNVAPASCCNSPVNVTAGVDTTSAWGMRVRILSNVS